MIEDVNIAEPSESQRSGHRRAQSARIVTIGLGILISVVAFAIGTMRGSAGRDRVSLTINPEDLDFGEAWVQDRFQWKLPVTNRGAETLEVKGFEASCHCVAIEPKSITITPGETAVLEVTLDLRPTSREQAGLDRWPFAVAIRPISRDDSPLPTWELSGQVRCLIRDCPTQIDFGEECVQGTVFPTTSLMVEAMLDVEDLLVQCDTALARVIAERDSANSRRFMVKATPASELPLGPFEIAVGLQAQSNGKLFPPHPLFLVGEVVTDIQFVPRNCVVPTVEVGDEVRQSVVLQSHTNRPFEVRDVQWSQEDSDNIELSVVPNGGIAIAGKHVYDVRASGLQSGGFKDVIRFRIEYVDEQRGVVDLDFQVTGRVIDESSIASQPLLQGSAFRQD